MLMSPYACTLPNDLLNALRGCRNRLFSTLKRNYDHQQPAIPSFTPHLRRKNTPNAKSVSEALRKRTFSVSEYHACYRPTAAGGKHGPERKLIR